MHSSGGYHSANLSGTLISFLSHHDLPLQTGTLLDQLVDSTEPADHQIYRWTIIMYVISINCCSLKLILILIIHQVNY